MRGHSAVCRTRHQSFAQPPARMLPKCSIRRPEQCRSYNGALPSIPFFSMQGIDEDTATGSAHCIIGPLFADILGKTSDIRCWQCSARGGAMTLDVKRERHMVAASALACLRSRGSLSWDCITSAWTRT